MSNYYQRAFDRAQREYDNATPPEYDDDGEECEDHECGECGWCAADAKERYEDGLADYLYEKHKDERMGL